MSKPEYIVVTIGGISVEPINCRCTVVFMDSGFGKQLDLFSSFSPATLTYEDLIKEIKR
jgi:hypothetical protein